MPQKFEVHVETMPECAAHEAINNCRAPHQHNFERYGESSRGEAGANLY